MARNHVGFAIRGSKIEGEKDLETGGFMTKRGEDLRKGSRAGLASDGLEISKPDELGIGTRGAPDQLPLHLLIFRTEIGSNF